MENPVNQMNIFLYLGGLVNPKGGAFPRLFKIYSDLRLISLLLFWASVISYVILGDGVLTDKMQAAQLTVSMTHIAGKHIRLTTRTDDFYEIVDEIEDLWKRAAKDPNNKKLFERVNVGVKRMAYLFYGSFAFVIVIFGAAVVRSHIYHGANTKPFQIYVPIEEFWLGSFVQIALYFNPAISVSSLMSIHTWISFNTSAQMKVLCKTFMDSSMEGNEMIKFHQRIIRLIKKTNSLLSGLFFLEMVVSTAQSAFSGYAFIKAFSKSDPSSMGHIFVFLLSVTVTCNVCYNGSLILKQSDKLYEAAYQNQWYNEGVNNRRKLLLIMTITTKDLSYGYKKLLTYDNELFATFLRGTYAYLSALQVMEQKGEL